jgi:hypothetical protein
MPVSLIISLPSTFDKLPRLLFKYQNFCEIQLLQKNAQVTADKKIRGMDMTSR